MKIISEDVIKKLHNNSYINEIQVEKGTFITKQAREYIEKNQLKITDGTSKPEHLTHIYGKELVFKNHPRIILRGKLDSFQADVLILQIEADRVGNKIIVEELQEILEFSRKIMGCEVTGKPMGSLELLGMDEKQLRVASQNPKNYFGVEHIAPFYRMGSLCIGLNQLRTRAREVELASITAFCSKGKIEREDIIQALNRLSSAIYIILCKALAEDRER